MSPRTQLVVFGFGSLFDRIQNSLYDTLFGKVEIRMVYVIQYCTNYFAPAPRVGGIKL